MTQYRLLPDLIDLHKVDQVELAGRGGQEKNISQLLSQWNRVNSPLYDFEISLHGTTYRLEVKRQSNLQWFDSGKYYNLSPQDRNIRIMFLLHKRGKINIIAITILEEFLDWLIKNRSSDGWNVEVLKCAADFKLKYPSLQFKARAHIATILNEAPELFDVIYRRVN